MCPGENELFSSFDAVPRNQAADNAIGQSKQQAVQPANVSVPSVQIAPKLTIARKGENAKLQVLTGGCSVNAQLAWTKKVDLDLWAFITLKDDPARTIAGEEVKVQRSGVGGVLKSIGHFLKHGGAETVRGKPIEVRKTHEVGYSCTHSVGPKGKTKWNGHSPYAWLDGDQGIGGQKGEEDENIVFEKPEKVEYALIAANIFGRVDAFSRYDGVVRIKAGGNEIEVPLTSDQKGNWCVVAGIDFTGETPKIININETFELPHGKRPTMKDWVEVFK